MEHLYMIHGNALIVENVTKLTMTIMTIAQNVVRKLIGQNKYMKGETNGRTKEMPVLWWRKWILWN